jgi:hypothetical protein
MHSTWVSFCIEWMYGDEQPAMIAADFRRIALSLDGAEEGSHMGNADFRVGGRIFATLASVRQGFGNLMLTPELQAAFVAERPNVFSPIPGGWGKNGATHIRLAEADESLLAGALLSAWKARVNKNQKVRADASGSGRRRRISTPESIEAANRHKAELRARLISPTALENVKRRYGLDE